LTVEDPHILNEKSSIQFDPEPKILVDTRFSHSKNSKTPKN